MSGAHSLDCRLLPHGAYTLLSATLASMGWIAILAQDGCDFVRLTGPSVSELTGSDAIPYLEIGINGYRQPEFFGATGDWRVQYTGQCIEYGESVADIYWILSKAFSFVALVFGGGGALFLWCSSFFVFGPGTWRWAGYEIFTASLCQAISFTWFLTSICSSEGNECSLFFGSQTDIAAASLWLLSALTIFFRYPKPTKKSVKPHILSSRDPEDGNGSLWDLATEDNNRAINLEEANIPHQKGFD